MAVKVLLVDDSAVIRGLMNKAITANGDIEVVGTAANGETAIKMASALKPDVIVLDIEMPVMDGITALPEIIKVSPGSKIIIASTLSQRNAEISLKALGLGASDYLGKPSAKFGESVDIFYRELIEKIIGLGGSHFSGGIKKDPLNLIQENKAPSKIGAIPSSMPPNIMGVKALAIASSTGGPQALMKVFSDIKGKIGNIPIFITQHMPPTFTTIFAGHLSAAGNRECVEAKEGMVVKNGCAYVAPGDFHMLAEKNAGNIILHISQDPPENFCRPAADPMLRSLSAIYGKGLAILVLTGMGQDGMLGAKAAVANGASVIAQDEATCVVYGMPKAVADAGLCHAVLPLGDIGAYLIRQIDGR